MNDFNQFQKSIDILRETYPAQNYKTKSNIIYTCNMFPLVILQAVKDTTSNTDATVILIFIESIRIYDS